MNKDEIKQIKDNLIEYKEKIKNDERKINEMNKNVEEIKQYLAKQKLELQNIYYFVNDFGIVLKREESEGIEPSVDEFLATLEQIKDDLKKVSFK